MLKSVITTTGTLSSEYDDSIEYQCRACVNKTPRTNKYNGGFCGNFYVPHRQIDPDDPAEEKIYNKPVVAASGETPIDCGVGAAIGFESDKKYIRCMSMGDKTPSPYCARGISLKFPSPEFTCSECLNSVPNKDGSSCFAPKRSEKIDKCEMYGRNSMTGEAYCSKCQFGFIPRKTGCEKTTFNGCLVDSAFVPENFYISMRDVKIKLLGEYSKVGAAGNLFGTRTTNNDGNIVNVNCLRCDYTNNYYSTDKNECTKLRN